MDVFEELRALGDALGHLAYVQGPGGNVSVKTDDELFVKASGRRLTGVESPDNHVAVPLALARRAYAGDAAAEAEMFALAPRPSLETFLHLFEGRVVAHTHALGALVYACTGATPPGDDVAVVPYARPGRPVADVMAPVMRPDLDVQAVLLASHGVVVVAPSADAAIQRTEEMHAAGMQRLGESDFDALVAEYCAAEVVPISGGFMTRLPDREDRGGRFGTPRYLFPDAVVCASQRHVETLDDPRAAAAATLASFGRGALVVDRAGRRALAAKSDRQLEFALEVQAAHDFIEDRLLASGDLVYLPDDEPAQILGLPSEQYRIALG